MPPRKLLSRDYHVAWIAPGPQVALEPARLMLDGEHHLRPRDYYGPIDYVWGEMAGHNVVIATTPVDRRTNVTIAALVAPMPFHFPNLKLFLLVGIGGGVPADPPTNDALLDIHLGDVVVGCTRDGQPSVVRFDSGKLGEDGLEPHGTIANPPVELSHPLGILDSNPQLHRTNFQHHIERLLQSENGQRYEHPGLENDRLFNFDYKHHKEGEECGTTCDINQIVLRPPRTKQHVQNLVFHLGRICTGEQIVATGRERHKISKNHKSVRCIECSAAGVNAVTACLVVRGISDYCDSHKNGTWKHYAAGMAAVFAKVLLGLTPPTTMEQMRTAKVDTEEIKATLLESLRFEKQPSRYTAIRNATSGTGDWILSKYHEWINKRAQQTSCFLWIKGKAGTGKSTLMKLLTNHVREDFNGSTEVIVISFFFNAQGEEVEHSVLGMYRSLLYQLINHQLASDLPKTSDWFMPGRYAEFDFPPEYEWTIDDLETLQTLFQETVKALGSFTILCFIDGLDESRDADTLAKSKKADTLDESIPADVASMVNAMASLRSKHLKICVSSRPYTSLTVQAVEVLELDQMDEHNEDLSVYIRETLQIGNSLEARDIPAQIMIKSSGIFLWVRLVVEQLNRDYKKNPFKNFVSTLHELPPDLEQLLLRRLLRLKGSPAASKMILCFQLILFAEVPLHLKEIYEAIMSATEPSSYWDPDRRRISTDDDVKCYLDEISEGLAEVVPSRVKTTGFQLQFIHESVRQSLITNGLVELAPDIKSNPDGLTQARLSQVCRDYFVKFLKWEKSVSSSTIVPTMSSTGPSFLRLPSAGINTRGIGTSGSSALTSDDFAFLDYSLHWTLRHSDDAVRHGIRQDTFLHEFPFSEWIDQLYERHTIQFSRRSLCVRMDNMLGAVIFVLGELKLKYVLQELENSYSTDWWSTARGSSSPQTADGPATAEDARYTQAEEGGDGSEEDSEDSEDGDDNWLVRFFTWAWST